MNFELEDILKGEYIHKSTESTVVWIFGNNARRTGGSKITDWITGWKAIEDRSRRTPKIDRKTRYEKIL